MTLAAAIYEFLESSEKVLVLRCCSGDFTEALSSLNIELNDDLETNGWQVDWWQTAMYKKQNLKLSGGAWYGTAKIEKHSSK